MSEEYEDELVTSHSDENPELSTESRHGPLAVHTTEGSAVSELYKSPSNDRKLRFGHMLQPTENVIYEEVYVPSVDHDS